MNKEYELDLKLKVRVMSDCPMRAADKVVRYVMKGPYEVLDWGFTDSIYPALRKVDDPPTPCFPMEAHRKIVRDRLAMYVAKIRAKVIEDLMISLKNRWLVLPFRVFSLDSKGENIESFPQKCWKCGARLEKRLYGLYCPTCQQYRKRREKVLHWKRRGAGH